MVVAVAAPVAVVVAVPSKSEIHNGVHSISTTRGDVALILRARGASLHVQPSRCAPNARPDIGIPKRRSLYVPPGGRTTYRRHVCMEQSVHPAFGTARSTTTEGGPYDTTSPQFRRARPPAQSESLL